MFTFSLETIRGSLIIYEVCRLTLGFYRVWKKKITNGYGWRICQAFIFSRGTLDKNLEVLWEVLYGMLTIQIKETQGRKRQVIPFKVYSPCSLYNIL